MGFCEGAQRVPNKEYLQISKKCTMHLCKLKGCKNLAHQILPLSPNDQDFSYVTQRLMHDLGLRLLFWLLQHSRPAALQPPKLEGFTLPFWKPSIIPNAPKVEGMAESLGYSLNLFSLKARLLCSIKRQMGTLSLHTVFCSCSY